MRAEPQQLPDGHVAWGLTVCSGSVQSASSVPAVCLACACLHTSKSCSRAGRRPDRSRTWNFENHFRRAHRRADRRVHTQACLYTPLQAGPPGVDVASRSIPPCRHHGPQWFRSNIPPGMPSNIPPGMPSNIPPGMPSNIPPGMPSNIPPGMPSNIPPNTPSSMPRPCRRSRRQVAERTHHRTFHRWNVRLCAPW